MNAPTNLSTLEETSTDLRVVTNDTRALVMDKGSMDSMMRVADLMASSKVTIPVHLRGSPGDCMAVVMQAMQWGMNPFSIAQKTHLSQGGALGYEAQLINAVLVASGAVRDEPEFEFIGDWSKILGKVEERKSDKGGKYYVPTYSKTDEDGLGVICTATLRSGSKRSIQVMMSQCYPRFSTQWATDPQQQITYVAVRKLARRYAPGAILGVYTPEELEESHSPREIDITPKSEPATQKPVFCTDEKFQANRTTWESIVTSGRKTAAELIIFLEAKAPLTDAQKNEIGKWKKKPVEPVTDTDDFVKALDKSGDYTPE
jgi:hypothetical protein